jgi:hypothetical protein
MPTNEEIQAAAIAAQIAASGGSAGTASIVTATPYTPPSPADVQAAAIAAQIAASGGSAGTASIVTATPYTPPSPADVQAAAIAEQIAASGGDIGKTNIVVATPVGQPTQPSEVQSSAIAAQIAASGGIIGKTNIVMATPRTQGEIQSAAIAEQVAASGGMIGKTNIVTAVPESKAEPSVTHVDSSYWNSLTPQEQTDITKQSAGNIVIHSTVTATLANLTPSQESELDAARSQGPDAYQAWIDKYWASLGISQSDIDRAIADARQSLANSYDQQAADAEAQGMTLSETKDEFVNRVMTNYVPTFDLTNTIDVEQVRTIEAFQAANVHDPTVADQSTGWYSKDWAQNNYTENKDVYDKVGISASLLEEEFNKGGMDQVNHFVNSLVESAILQEQLREKEQAIVPTTPVAESQSATWERALLNAGHKNTSRYVGMVRDLDMSDYPEAQAVVQRISDEGGPQYDSGYRLRSGYTDEQLREIYRALPEEQRQSIAREYAREVGMIPMDTISKIVVGAIPVIGTIQSVEERGWKSGYTLGSVASDIATAIPLVGEFVSIPLKASVLTFVKEYSEATTIPSLVRETGATAKIAGEEISTIAESTRAARMSRAAEISAAYPELDGGKKVGEITVNAIKNISAIAGKYAVPVDKTFVGEISLGANISKTQIAKVLADARTNLQIIQAEYVKNLVTENALSKAQIAAKANGDMNAYVDISTSLSTARSLTVQAGKNLANASKFYSKLITEQPEFFVEAPKGLTSTKLSDVKTLADGMLSIKGKVDAAYKAATIGSGAVEVSDIAKAVVAGEVIRGVSETPLSDVTSPGSSTIGDVAKEAMSLGKIETATFNADDIGQQYDNQVGIGVATMNGNKDELTNLYNSGAFGNPTSEGAIKSYNAAIDKADQVSQFDNAVERGDTDSLNDLYNRGYFGDPKEADTIAIYQSWDKYVRDGGRDPSRPTDTDIQEYKDKFGTKDDYIKSVLDAQPQLSELAKELALSSIPVYGTIRSWDEMSGTWKVVSIGADVLSVIPFAIGIYAGARVASESGAMARVMGGLKTIPNLAIGEALGPVASLKRPFEFGITAIRPSYIPLRSMATEAATKRVEFTPSQLLRMRAKGVTEQDIINAGTELNKQLASGVKTAKVELGGVKVEVDNIPYQRTTGGLRLFNATTDVTQLDRGVPVPLNRTFYTASQVAIEPMQRQYLTGMKATNPGIIEVVIDDPSIIEDIMPQRKLIHGGTVLEPEAVLPSIEELEGMGYRLDPIAGPAGKGVSFDANLGTLQIRRYTISKVVDNPTGLKKTFVGMVDDGGVVAVGDLHGTVKTRAVFDDMNSGWRDNFVVGNPENPDTWHVNPSATKNRTIVSMGDSIDRGPNYDLWRRTQNRLSDEAASIGDRAERVLGNHELAYLIDDAISGIKYTDKEREIIKAGIKEDILSGKVKAAVEVDGKLYTHAGVSLDAFPEYKGKDAKYIADDLNQKLIQSVKEDNYGDKMFAKGRVEKGHSLSKNEREVGGPFWLRPQESAAKQLDLGFVQVVGHNPGVGIREIWGKNFIETDVGRRSGGVGAYIDTPYIKTEHVPIKAVSLGGMYTPLNPMQLTQLRLQAMKDTVADAFLGWDGRVKAWEKITKGPAETEKRLKVLDAAIAERKAAGDSIGVKYIERQKKEILLPENTKEYIFSDYGAWRDLVMGRQNSVKVLGGEITPSVAGNANATINMFRNQINGMSNDRVESMFGIGKDEILSRVVVPSSSVGDPRYAIDIRNSLNNLSSIVDSGLEYSVVPYMDQDRIVSRYANTLQARIYEYSSEYPRSIDSRYMPSDSRVSDSGRMPSYERAISDGRVPSTERFPSPDRIPPPERIPDVDRVPTVSRIPSTDRIPPSERIPSTERIPPTGRIPPSGRVPDVGRIPPSEGIPPIDIPQLEPSGETLLEREILSSKGAIAIPHGKIRQGTELQQIWYVIKYPYKSEKDAFRLIGKLPKGVLPVKAYDPSTYHNVQLITGIPPKKLTLDLGLQDITITSQKGQNLQVSYKKDPKQRTKSQINLKKVTTVRS